MRLVDAIVALDWATYTCVPARYQGQGRHTGGVGGALRGGSACVATRVCVHVSVYACVCVCMSVCTRACVISVYVCVGACISIRTVMV